MDLNSFMNSKKFKDRKKPKKSTEIMDLVKTYNLAEKHKLTKVNFLYNKINSNLT